MNIGKLERLAGVTDREAFWMPFAKYEDGLQKGVAELRKMAGVDTPPPEPRKRRRAQQPKEHR
ncbi:hypothetical protein H9Q09_01010 [Aurantimonas sp. DM33-3]|uniref:hypothetical protein n=1 Tax=Aurantimonas sp. DM33-3 TaxID=2766955 RepID=UPI001652B316|nr:hypothetical protein [Aurantimonas sp. DM33-3]MBC6714764.1 hypothetical protein [Aurantimonas sp. DM33-3]